MSDNDQELNEPEIIHVDVDPDMPVTQIESLCYDCGENGTTTFYLTSIPHFKEIIISSFRCDFCNAVNNSVQYGGSIEPKGVRYAFRVKSIDDLDRQIVKSDYASIVLPDLDFEIPPQTQKGILSTIEGILRQAHDNLAHLQPIRRIQDPENAAKIDEFLAKLNACIEVQHPFTIILDDYSGNSFIENPFAPSEDPEMIVRHYVRSREQDENLGIDTEMEQRRLEAEREAQRKALEERKEGNKNRYENAIDVGEGMFYRQPGGDASVAFDKKILEQMNRSVNEEDIDERIMSFPSPCSACTAEGMQRMITVDIPYFKEVIIMAFSCDNCGYRNSDVKTGGAISPYGRRHTLVVKDKWDLSRDVLKSDSASLEIPELEFAVTMGSMGKGGFTTVEGILYQIKETLLRNPFLVGDSPNQTSKERFLAFNARLKRLLNNEEEFTLIIDDPLSNSYVQNIYYPEPDVQLTVENYERTWEQNDELGLNDMNVDHYLGDIENPDEVYGRYEDDEVETIPDLTHNKGIKTMQAEKPKGIDD